MKNTHSIRIALPHNRAAMVKAKVAAGEYATESEVTRDGIRMLPARDREVESWLRDEVAKSHDELVADPSIGIPAGEVMARLHASYLEHQAKSAS